jgi:vacuolar-type H+-ATPase subunit H
MKAGRHTRPAAPLEPAEAMLAAIRSAETAAAARVAAEQENSAQLDHARSQAAELLTAATARAAKLAEQRRRRVRAGVDADAQRELAAGAARAGQLLRSARQYHDQAVQTALALVLTGEERPCSSR